MVEGQHQQQQHQQAPHRCVPLQKAQPAQRQGSSKLGTMHTALFCAMPSCLPTGLHALTLVQRPFAALASSGFVATAKQMLL